jgi:hypothetical protein
MADLPPGTVDVLVWGGIILAVVLVFGSICAVWLRRRLLSGGGRGGRGGFDVERLEGLRRAGRISEEEFRALRRAALGIAAASGPAEDCASRADTQDDDGGDKAEDNGPCGREEHR